MAVRTAVLAWAALLAAACTPRKAPPPPFNPAPPLIAEAPLPASGAADFEIGPIDDSPSEDGSALFVQGTVRNTGTRASRDVKVAVEGLDARGTRIARAEALPVPQEIPPGTVGTFVVRLPNDPAIKRFHVEAIGR
jgi:hypothetical protein